MTPTHPLKPPHDYLIWVYRIIFALVVPIAIWMAHKPMPQVYLPLLNRQVTAYYVIRSNDISMKWVDRNGVTSDSVHEMNDLIGHYTLASILPGQPVHESQVGPKPNPILISNTLAVAIPANSTLTIGSNLHAGDIVQLSTIPLSSTTSLPSIIFDKVLVLDVKSVGSQTVIILAIPTDRWLDYLTKTHNAIVVLARQVE